MELREYQKHGIEFLKANKYACLADAPGLGKTAQAICAAPNDGGKILVICPAQVKFQWLNQFLIWRGQVWLKDHIHIIQSSKETIPKLAHILIVNYDLVIRDKIFNQLRDMKFSCVICDEAHRLKNINAKRTRRVLSKHGLKPTAERMWFLTGTPIKNRPVDLYSLLASTRPELLHPYGSYLRFVYRFCGAYQGPFGLIAQGASHISDLENRIRPFFLRREKREVLHELPPRIVDVIELDCSEEARELIEAEQLRTYEMAGEDDPAKFKLGEIVRIRNVIAKYKVPDSVMFIEDKLQEEDKVVVFFHHLNVGHELKVALKKYNPVVISGEDSPLLRQAKVDRFCDPKNNHRVFLGQIQATGEGIDGLQHVCSTCIFVEPSWSPTDIDQCIGRLERMGQKDSINAYLLVIRGTVESDMMRTMEWKDGVIRKLIQPTNPTTNQGEYQMYLEQRVEKLEGVVEKLANAVLELTTALTKDVSAKIAQPTPTAQSATTAAEPAPKKTKKAEKPPVIEEKFVEDDEDEPEPTAKKGVSEDEVRALAAQICTKFPNGKGKERCTAIIRQLGGAKLHDLKGDALDKCYELFTEVVNEG